MPSSGYEVFLSHAGGDDGVKLMLTYVRRDINLMPPQRTRAFLDNSDLKSGRFASAIRAALSEAVIGAVP